MIKNCCGPPGYRGFGAADPTKPSMAPALIGAGGGFMVAGPLGAAVGAAAGYLYAKKGPPSSAPVAMTTQIVPSGNVRPGGIPLDQWNLLPVGGGFMPPVPGGGIVVPPGWGEAWVPPNMPFTPYTPVLNMAVMRGYGQAWVPGFTPAFQPGGNFGQDDAQQQDPSQQDDWSQWCPVDDEVSLVEAITAADDTAATDALTIARVAPPATGGMTPHLVGAGIGFVLAGPLGAAAGALLPFLGKK